MTPPPGREVGAAGGRCAARRLHAQRRRCVARLCVERRQWAAWLAGERGSTVIPMVLLVFLLLSAGGLGFDLYRLVVTRQTVVGIVDSAAIAGATAVDEEQYFASQGEVLVLDPALARERASTSLSGHSSTLADASIDVAVDGSQITVVGAIDMEFSLLRLLLPTLGSAHVQASATSEPRAAS